MKPLTYRQVTEILRDNGFYLEKSEGSHFKWRNAAGCSVAVPHHGNKPLKQGTLLSIFRKSGITPPQR